MKKRPTPEISIDVVATNFWEFRDLLKMAYAMDYRFGKNQKHGAFKLWFLYECNGLSFYEETKRLKYIERACDIDTITVDEFCLILSGAV